MTRVSRVRPAMRRRRVAPLGFAILSACRSVEGAPPAEPRDGLLTRVTASQSNRATPSRAHTDLAPQRVKVALTFDDLPWSGPPPRGGSRAGGNARIIASLRARGITAAGFVNCANVGPDTAILHAWRSAGFELGNHTARHVGLDAVGASQWLRDVEECHGLLQTQASVRARYFRYPMLRQGATAARRDSAAQGLARMGYINAHVSIDNSDYLFAHGYRVARDARDAEGAGQIATLYVAHLRATMQHARDVARRKLGRDVAHVLLLHANLLNAERLDAVLDALAKDGAEFVPLVDALHDPVYALPDAYVGPRGRSWLYRFAPLDASDAAWDDAETARVEAALARIASRRSRAPTTGR